MKLRLHVIVFTGLFFLIFSSCKKEYIDKYNEIAGDTIQVIGYKDITSFQVKEFSNDTVLKASIKDDTIIVYWPSYKAMPKTIKPAITLPDSATIVPASGEEVAFKTGTMYQVTSGIGTSHTYVLKVEFQQPEPWFFSALTSSIFENGSYQTLGRGDYFIPDTAMTRVYLVAATDSTEYQAEVFTVTNEGPGFFVPMNVPAGLYDVKVVNGIHTIYNSLSASRSKLTIAYPTYPQVFTVTIPATLHRNDTFEVRGCLLGLTNTVSLYNGSLKKSDLEIVSVAADKLVLRVPADFPFDNYIALQLLMSDGQDAIGNIDLNVVN